MSSNLDIVSQFNNKFQRSYSLYQRAKETNPNAVHSHIRNIAPFPLYVEGASGCRKKFVDDFEVIDYWMGHASLLHGHCSELIYNACHEQLRSGTHFAAPCELEISVAEAFLEKVYWAGKIRFCGTGSESVLLALRVARAATKRKEFVRLSGHYHGWYDEQLLGTFPPGLNQIYEGIPTENTSLVNILPPNDLDQLEKQLATEKNAAIIIEPNGGFGGAIEHSREYLLGLRKLCDKYGTLLIFDEMITGFRFGLGGAAEYFDVAPDLATYGKALFGGMSGAALAGKSEFMELLGPKPIMENQVVHQGTWNAAPLSLAAANTVLNNLDTKFLGGLNDKAETLRSGLTRALDEAKVPGRIYGQSSLVHIYLGDWPLEGTLPKDIKETSLVTISRMGNPNMMLRLAMLLEGVDFFTHHMNAMSSEHTESDIESTVNAFKRSLDRLKQDRIFE